MFDSNVFLNRNPGKVNHIFEPVWPMGTEEYLLMYKKQRLNPPIFENYLYLRPYIRSLVND